MDDTNSNFQNFIVQLRRHYPQVLDVAQSLADDYTHSIQQIGNRKGNLEIEASFGKIVYNSTGTKYCNNALPQDVIREIIEVLSTFGGWSSISDWYLVYDYDLGNRKRVRVSYENQTQSISCITKEPLFSRDIGYDEKSTQTWKLRECTTRINTKFEVQNTYTDDKLLEFKNVRISMRKYFVVPSNNIPTISWSLEIIQSWYGTTVADAELKMLRDPPECRFECEIVNLQSTDQLSRIQKILLFSSFLLKIQDLFDIPNTIHSSPLPFFKLL